MASLTKTQARKWVANKRRPKKLMAYRTKENAILTFLRETKEGKYAPIEESSLEYVRMEDDLDNTEVSEENFYYSIG